MGNAEQSCVAEGAQLIVDNNEKEFLMTIMFVLPLFS